MAESASRTASPDHEAQEGRTQREVWAQRFVQQGEACGELGSPLWHRLLLLIGRDIATDGPSWQVMRQGAELRFGQAGPLRLVGSSHRLALEGRAEEWASLLPSCGGTPPEDDAALLAQWHRLVETHGAELAAGLAREVQTNEVARSAGLSLALAETRFEEARLVEIGCSGGLNLRLDRFEVDLAGMVLGDAGSDVHVRPGITGGLGGLRHVGLSLPRITERVGLDPHPVDATSDEGRLTLLSFLWPDQSERIQRARAAIDIARHVPAELITVAGGAEGDTADALAGVLARGGSTVVSHSIVWQYIPTDVRWRITEAMEQHGAAATEAASLAWIRYEPDHWDRRRAAVWLRTWPDGGDRLVAHIDYHGRWLAPA
ncbi:MAG: DUF2332 domain-containing protein [Microthrixaceae bacterium]